MIDPTQWTRAELENHSVDMRQFIDARQSTLPNGMRIIDCYNASGLHFTVLPDRGMDIWTAHYKGIPLTWISQGSPHPPDYGQSWLRQFNGGLLTTCGLSHVGPPEVDDVTGEQRDIHGNYTRLRTESVTSFGTWHDNQLYTYELRGKLAEARLFGEQFAIERTFRMALNQPTLHISTVVRNMSDMPQPLMFLYHINLGFPLIQEGTRLAATGTVYPRDDAARMGLGTWVKYAHPAPGYPEQVFFHHVQAQTNEFGSNVSYAALLQDDFGLQFTWHTDELPYLTQWKNTRQGIYVCGIEPGNCIPNGQNAARKNSRLSFLQPGEQKEFICELKVLDGKAAVGESKEKIEALKQTGALIDNCHLKDYVNV